MSLPSVKPISEIAYLEFFVPGKPCPQGSKNAFRRGKRIILVESCKGLPAWREAVSSASLAHCPSNWQDDATYEVSLEFYFARPKSDYRSGVLRADAPCFHVTRPDGDKLSRAILDACTGTLWSDDSRVSIGRWTKQYAPSPLGGSEACEGVRVRVTAF
jgi:Holliday junction resolvase RusA-like endonuclease